MSHISKQTIQAVAAKQDALAAQQQEVFYRQMQESFDEAQSVAATRLRFASDLITSFKDAGYAGISNAQEFARQTYVTADALAQEHHRRATADRIAWFTSKGLTPPMAVQDSAKRMGIDVPKPAEVAPKPLVVVD